MDSVQVPAGSVVVGVDGSTGSMAALEWAADQAVLEQRQLTVVHAVDPAGRPTLTRFTATGVDYRPDLVEVRDAAAAVLDTACTRASAGRPELLVEPLLSDSDAREVLLDLSDEAAMVVVGSRGYGPIGSLLLGSVSVAVSKHASCPVVVHRPTSPEGERHGILVGVDGQAHSAPAVEFAYRMASWRSLPLTVLHTAWDACAHTSAPVPDDGSEAALVSESLAGMREKFPDVEVSVRITTGFADNHLVTASRNYDLLVIGHLKVPLLQEFVYGSLAPAVVEHAHGTVAVVPALLPVLGAPSH